MECDGKCWHFRDYYNEGSKINGSEARRKPCSSLNVTCEMFGIRCKGEDVCIEHSHVCDGINDCTDGSDEDEEFCLNCGRDRADNKIMKLSKKDRYSRHPDTSWRYYCYNEAFNNRCPGNPIRYVCENDAMQRTHFVPIQTRVGRTNTGSTIATMESV